MKTKIKICGLKRIEDVISVNVAEPDYCGFIFNVSGSRRSIGAEQLNILVDMLVPQRTFLAGWTVLMPALYLLLGATRSQRRLEFVATGLLAGCMLMINTHAFLALGLLLLSGEEYSGIPLQAVLILVPFGGMILAALDAAEVHKSYKYQMWEIEASCANSLREVMLQRLLLSGGITTFILMLLAAFASVQLRISLIQLLSFFLSPFLLVTGSYLYLLRHLRGRMNEMILLAAVILCGMGLMLGLEFLELYTESMLLFSVAVFIVMLLFALRELKRCFSRKERHEWN